MTEIKLDYLTITYEEPILYHRYTKSKMIGAGEIRAILDADFKLTQGKPYVLLSDTRSQIELRPDAYEEYGMAEADKRTANIVANAVIVKWLAQRLVANVFSEVNKPPHPLEIFTDEEAAVKWLKEEWQKRKR